MTDNEKRAGILEFITASEEALTDPCIIANPGLGENIRLSLIDAKRQLEAVTKNG